MACIDVFAASGGSPLRGSGLMDRADARFARSISAFTNESPLRAPACGSEVVVEAR
jgi:hypothetical protein